jgi:hypothetical protein
VSCNQVQLCASAFLAAKALCSIVVHVTDYQFRRSNMKLQDAHHMIVQHKELSSS